jgi:hypothetical protein
VLVAFIAASTLASCGKSVLDAGGERHGRDSGGRHHSAAHGPQSSKQQQDHVKNEKKDAGTRSQERSDPADGSSGITGVEDAGTSTDGGGNAPGTHAGTGSSQPAAACSTDMPGDMDSSGSPPTYADLTRGCIHEDGAQVLLEATTVGALPARMPDQDTNLAIAFTLESPSGSTLYVTAEATEAGWSAYSNRGGQRQTLPLPTVSGKLVRVAIPASEVVGAVEWRVESSWLRSTLVSTAYAFDDAPNGGTNTFDRG